MTSTENSLWDFIGIYEDPIYRWILLAFGSLVAVNVTTFLVGTGNLSYFKLSKTQWWGSFTSIGLYDSWESTLALILLPFLWFTLNTRLPSAERRRRSLLFIIGSGLATILANFIWTFSNSQFEFTFGVSGFDVAAGGIILVCSLVNLFGLKSHLVPNLVELRATDKQEMKSLLAFVYTILIVFMILTWVTLVELSDSTINTEVHEVSLTVSFGLAIAFEVFSISSRPPQGPTRT